MKILDIALKDLTRSLRNTFLLGMGFGAPLLLSLLMYFALGSMAGGDGSMITVQVGVVNADVLPAGAPLQVALGEHAHSMFFDDSVKSWITASDYPDEKAARLALDAQEIGVAVIIPRTFTRDYLAGSSQTPITVIQDPTLSIGPTVIRDMLASLLDGIAGGGVVIQTVNARLQASGQTLDPAAVQVILDQYSAWYADYQRLMFHNPDKAAFAISSTSSSGSSSSSLETVLGLIMSGQLIFFSFFTGAMAMQSILQESEEGTLQRLFTTPTSRTAILAGKFTAVFFIVVIQGVFLVTCGRLMFGIDWGRPAALALALLGQMFASVGLAVLLVSFVKTIRQAGFVIGGALTALGMLSGLFTTNIRMPDSYNAIGNFTPQGWVLKAWKLVLAGQPAADILLPLTVLLLMGLVMFAVGAVLFRRRYA